MLHLSNVGLDAFGLETGQLIQRRKQHATRAAR